DTTVFYSETDDIPDTYIITGDIDAMWLRDSSAQVNHYIPLAQEDEKIAKLINGLIRRQARCILIDPYANAFYRESDKVGEWKSDMTEMKPGVHERKWELDSLTYCIRLAWKYWKTTGDTSAFDDTWIKAMQLAVDTMIVQQRKHSKGPYSFMRRTEWQTDTVPGAGFGNPIKPNGMICSTFRNSDDAATYLFNIPENLMAVVNLRRLSEMLDAMDNKTQLARRARELADEVEAAVKEHGIIKHPKYGRMYAYEVDGFGNTLLIDDAGLPSIVSIPYLGYDLIDDDIYQNSRTFALSDDNPYFYKGKAAEGTGSPHLARVGDGMIWPMGISSRILTSKNPSEIRKCLDMLVRNTGGTGFMHEGFHKDDGGNYTRPW
ncbi:MAG: glycoside hydrolase family 125 protein, partial [Luteolibacter sp.]